MANSTINQTIVISELFDCVVNSRGKQLIKQSKCKHCSIVCSKISLERLVGTLGVAWGALAVGVGVGFDGVGRFRSGVCIGKVGCEGWVL